MKTRAGLLAVLVAGMVGSGVSVARAADSLTPLSVLLGPWALLILGLSALALPLAAWALVRVARHGDTLRAPALLRASFVWAVLGAVFLLARAQPIQRVWLELAFGPLTSVLAATVLLSRRRPEPPARWRRALDFLSFNACLVLVLTELALRALALASTSPLLAQPDLGTWRYVGRFATRPGQVHMGFATNSLGCFDEDFLPPRGDVRVVATIGDSFSQGVVPFPFHYTTVCEDLLQDVRVDNYGFAAIGPPEYLHLLRDDVLPARPDLVVVSLFLGNDLTLTPVLGALPGNAVRVWLGIENLLVYQVPRRLAAGGAVGANLRRVGDGRRLDSLEAIVAGFPFVLDPLLEQPRFSAEQYWTIELGRARQIAGGRLASQRDVFAILSEMRALCGDIPFALMLIPDEFQVEDPIWDGIQTRLPDVELDRDLAQRQVIAFLEQEGVPYVDLLPAMRAVEPMEDGLRHLYHLRDTHINARGNRVAAECLAQLVSELLAPNGRLR